MKNETLPPTPPSFTLSSGRTVFHSATETDKGMRFQVHTEGENPLPLSTEEGKEYSKMMTEWIHSMGFIVTRNTIL